MDERAQRAVDLRVAGLSRSEIKTALGVRSSKMLTAWLRGTPPPAWTARPNAKDDLRERAIALRLEGRAYNEIKQILGVSKSTLSLWLRDVPLTEEHRAALAQGGSGAVAKRAQARRARRIRHDEVVIAVAREEITDLSERELFIAGLVAYWAEGSKNKPWGKNTQGTFINSDPGMVLLFLAWLRLLGIGTDAVTFRVAIHESADAAGAEEYWAGVVGVSASVFRRTTLKRHNPRTLRKNVSEEYHGCLAIYVRRSTELNLMIGGWCEGLARTIGTMIRTQSGVV